MVKQQAFRFNRCWRQGNRNKFLANVYNLHNSKKSFFYFTGKKRQANGKNGCKEKNFFCGGACCGYSVRLSYALLRDNINQLFILTLLSYYNPMQARFLSSCYLLSLIPNCYKTNACC